MAAFAVLIAACAGTEADPPPAGNSTSQATSSTRTVEGSPTTASTTTTVTSTSSTAGDATPSCDGDAAATSSLVAASWDFGDRVTLNLTRRRMSGGLTLSYSETPVTIEVRGADEDGYSLAFDLGQPDVERMGALPLIPAELVEGILDLSAVTLQYETDEAGGISRLTNEPDIDKRSAELGEFFDGWLAELDDVARRDAEAAFYSLTIVDALYRDAAIYHSLYGVELGTTAADSVELANPFGGEPISAMRTITVSPEPLGRCIRITATVKPDRDRFEEVMTETIAAIAAYENRPVDEVRDELGVVSVFASTVYEWDPISTWMIQIRSEQKTTIDGITRSDISIMTLEE